MKFLTGYKTYIIGVAAILGALAGYLQGAIAFPEAANLTLIAAVGMGLRQGVATEIRNVLLALGINLPTSPPPEQVKREASLRSGTGNKVLSLFLVFGLLGGSLFGLRACATPGGEDPISQLRVYEGWFQIGQATYNAICSVHTPPGFCVDRSAYDSAAKAIEAAFATAEAILLVNPSDQASIANLIPVIVSDWLAYSDIVNSVKSAESKRRGVAFRPLPR